MCVGVLWCCCGVVCCVAVVCGLSESIDISVVARSDTDVQIVRYIPLSSFPSGELEWNTFIRYSE